MMRQLQVGQRRGGGLGLWEKRNGRISRLSKLPQNRNRSVRAAVHQLESCGAVALRTHVGQVDDRSDVASFDSRMRGLEKSRQRIGLPMIAARFGAIFVHSLLNYAPMPIGRREESMQIELKSVLHGGAVDFGDQSTRSHERR